jgi:dATP pyrophosphohydrolase
MTNYKQPRSVLVVIYTRDAQALLLERADRPGFWQSVTGSCEGDEELMDTARREVREETGLQAEPPALSDWQQTTRFEIYAHWRHRYAPGVTHNDEHVFGLELPTVQPVTLAPDEHLRWQWLPLALAAERVFSPSNAAALRYLAQRFSP